jgi:apolipoprotein D and lipocalin family protein
MRVFAIVTTGLFAAQLVLAQQQPLSVVPHLDLQKYAGVWYEIARFPNRFQEKCAGDVTAEYQPRPDGRVTVINRCRTRDGGSDAAEGVARPLEGAPSSALEVRFAPAFLSFLPNVWGDYQVMALDDAYTYSLVGTPDRKYLWVLSRTPSMDEAAYQKLLAIAAGQGFATSRLVKTAQTGATN